MKTQHIAIALIALFVIALGVIGYYTYENRKQANINSQYVGGVINYINTQIEAGNLTTPAQ